MNLKYLFLCFFLLFFTNPTLADDPGITKVRLIQLSDSSYRIEADIAQQLIWAIKQPIFPDRFEVSEINYENKKGWVEVNSVATTNFTGLNRDDELLLPWLRNGADLTVRWLDGSISKGLFIRSLDGIHIPMSQLIVEELSDKEIIINNFLLGFQHSYFHGIHIIFILALVLLIPNVNALKVLLWFSLGQGLSLVISDFHFPEFDLLLIELFGLVLAFILASISHSSKNIRQIIPILTIYGLLHGLGLYNEIGSTEISAEQKRIAQFFALLAVEVCQFAIALIIITVLTRFSNIIKFRYIPGSLAIFLILVLFNDYVKVGNTQILQTDNQINATQYQLPASQPELNSGNLQQGARVLSTPIMSYVTIEPYEVRLEILIQARTAVRILGVDDRGMRSIPIQSLEPIQKGILDAITNYNNVQINKEEVTPIFSRADFVTLSAAGVLLREVPQIESLDKGILGLTIVYETNGLPEDFLLDWNVFPGDDFDIETTVIDPFGGSVELLSKTDSSLSWKKQLSDYTVPVVDAVAYQKPKLPLFSVLLFAAALVLLLIKKTRRLKTLQTTLIAIGLLFYPLFRTKSSLPLVNQWKPSEERSAKVLKSLLTNVYRSFDVRNESDVYDRLSTSVEGDQLTEIYLQNRQSMELEYRGGARAKVDELDIEEIKNIVKNENGDFEVEALWLVGGSVSHFGHTHYRRNFNHAFVTFGIIDDSWKIKKIEMIDEKRII